MFKKVKYPWVFAVFIVIAGIITCFNFTHLIKLYEYYTLGKFVGLAGVTFLVVLTVYMSFLGSYLNVDPNILKEKRRKNEK